MRGPRVEAELIFCLQAVQMGLSEARTLVDVGLAWSRGDAASLREELVARCGIAQENCALVDQTVALILGAHGGDVGASLESLGGGRVLESLGGALEAASPMPAELPAGERPDEVTPEHPGRYELRGEHGRGGIGRVLVAFDEHVGREIAIKELLVGEGAGTPATGGRTTAATSRFLREARLTGQLEHPSIVPVYEVGQRTDGTLYYAMRLVRGRTLADAIAEANGVEPRLGLLPHFGHLCSAIAYAHSRGVLHRDIKPQNVMIGEFGETVVLDWGLAKLKGDLEDRRFVKQMEALKQAAAGKTVMGEALGTPEYMPPEQAWGELDEVDERSDVYSLGAALYEILTGQPPFTGQVAFEVIGRVQAYGEGREPLLPVREREAGAPAELAAIAEKALAAHPDDRYPSARALHADISAFMAGRRVGAYEYSAWELIRRIVERHRAVAGMAAALLLFLVVGSALLANAWRTAADERAAAQQSERRAHAHLADGYQEKAERLVSERDLLGAKIFAAAALGESPFNPAGPHHDPAAVAASPAAAHAQLASLQSTLWAASEALVRHHARLDHEGLVSAVAFSADGAVVATGDLKGRVSLWRAEDGGRLRSIEAGSRVLALGFSARGALLAVSLGDGTVRLFDAASGTAIRVLADGPERANQLAFAPDGALLAAGNSREPRVVLWNPSSGDRVGTIELGEAGGASELSFAPDSSRLLIAGPAKSLTIWDTRRRKVVRAFEAHADAVRGLAMSPDGGLLVTMGDDQALRLWSLPEADLLDIVPLGFKPRALAVDFDERGAVKAAVAREQGGVELLDFTTGRRIAAVHGHRGQVRRLLMTADGAMLATAGMDDRVHLWALAEASEHRLHSHDRPVSRASASADGRLLLTEGGGLVLWDTVEREARALPEGLGQVVERAALSPGGRRLAVVADRAELRVADLQEGRIAWSSPIAARRLVFSADGATLAVAAGSVAVFDASDGSPRGEVQCSHRPAIAIALSPQGERLACAGLGPGVEVWDLKSGGKIATLATGEDAIASLAFSHDGASLACGGSSGTITLWDPSTGEASHRLQGHRSVPATLGYSHDGSLLVSTGWTDGEVRLWDPKLGRLVQVFSPPSGGKVAAFIGDGRTLAFNDGPHVLAVPLELELWRTDPAALLEAAEREAGMRLSGFGLSAE